MTPHRGVTGVSSFDSDDCTEVRVTGQELFGSYENTGAVVAADLVNALAVRHAFGRPVEAPDPVPALREVLAVDQRSVAQLRRRDAPAFVVLAGQLRDVFARIAEGDLDGAAGRLNALLALHPAHPHLAKEDGVWRLHHHPAEAALVPMWTAICAEGLARVVGAGEADRLGTCGSDDCDRVFVDGSRNASRRFCSTTCQNRVKAAAFRRRHA
jgi:predicted RNA-binding Zn ribbon-like protein